MISIEDLVPKDRILCEIDVAIDFSFIYDEVEGIYSDFDGGRPGIDHEKTYKGSLNVRFFPKLTARQRLSHCPSIFHSTNS